MYNFKDSRSEYYAFLKRMDMPDKDLSRLDIDSVMPYDCIRLKYAWAEQSEKYHNGEINRDEYDKWRYTIIRSMMKLPDL